MPKNKGKPSVDELIERAHSLIEEAADRDALYDRVDDLYDQSRPDAATTDAENVQLIKMPYGTNAVDLVADLAAQMERSITIPAAKETAQAKRDADLMEEWLLAWVNINERLQQSNFTADAAWFGAQRSQVIMRCLYYEPAAQEIKKGSAPLATPPVILQIRDPRYVYHSVGVVGLECVVEGWQRTAAEIRRTYPDALDEDEYPDDMLVEWVEYWDDKWRCYWAAGEDLAEGRRRGRAWLRLRALLYRDRSQDTSGGAWSALPAPAQRHRGYA
jgi:hypothetical protein